ncbi:hypothetical protein KDM87_01675 [Undibacterium sp. FT147W]|uniref:Uncharacterized protein n=1 Tax=Undibacterium rivi TaxID=2828729 RepID=A0ABS5GXW1_9BURK|nr:hypothetical protein [Undibacterium rivi]MBR7791291.1 hypothetical protein [Undibacterium rivi]
MMITTMNKKSAGMKIGSLSDITPSQTFTEIFTRVHRNAHAGATMAGAST